MKVIIYGFKPEILEYSMKEICFFLFIFTILVVIMGWSIERSRMDYHYMQLIRYNKLSCWWRKRWIKQILFSILLILVLFCCLALVNIGAGWDLFDNGIVLPIALWITNICMISCVQMLLSIFPRGTTISILLILLVEVFSLYAYPLVNDGICYFPGSYMMLQRTDVMNEAMPILAIIIIEVTIIVSAGIFGHRLYRRSNC